MEVVVAPNCRTARRGRKDCGTRKSASSRASCRRRGNVCLRDLESRFLLCTSPRSRSGSRRRLRAPSRHPFASIIRRPAFRWLADTRVLSASLAILADASRVRQEPAARAITARRQPGNHSIIRRRRAPAPRAIPSRGGHRRDTIIAKRPAVAPAATTARMRRASRSAIP